MTIDKNIPVPPSRKAARHHSVLAQMQVGDSVLVSQKEAINVYGWFRTRGMRCVQRAEWSGGQYVGQRVWRTT